MRIRYMVGLVVLVGVLWSVMLAAMVAARGWNTSKCPYCLSSRIRQSRPVGTDRVLRYIHVKAYRCEACLKRFHALKRKPAEKSMRAGAG
jgi:transposase-like protein